MGNFVASNLKELNRRTVYTLLQTECELSKAEIARRSGISPPTVMKIIDFFMASGIVEAAGDGNSALGRKPRLLRYLPTAVYAVGAEFDGFHLRIGLVDLAGKVRSIITKRVDPDIRTLLSAELVPAVQELVEKSGVPATSVIGLGLGIPGVIGPDLLTISFAPFVGVDAPLDLGLNVSALEKELGMPVSIENDANAAALGEYKVRSLGEDGDLLYLELGCGLGSGLIMDGHLRRGPRAFTGELGYLVVDPTYQVNPGTPGWLESYINLGEFWNEVSLNGVPSPCTLERVVKSLALAVTNTCVMLDIGLAVVSSGGLGSFLPDFVLALQKKVDRFSVMKIRCEAPVNDDGGVSGAASLATEVWLKGFLAG